MLPATWIATIRMIRAARRRRKGSNSPRSRLSSARSLRDRGVGGAGVIGAEDRRARDEQARTGGRHASGSAGIDAAVDLDGAGANHRLDAADLVWRVGDEGLAAPARVDRHAEEDIGVVDRLADGRHRRPWVDGKARKTAELPDRAEGAVDVRRRLGVESDVVGPGLGELLDLAVGVLDHEVHVDRSARVVDEIGDGTGNEGADRDGWDEVA